MFLNAPNNSDKNNLDKKKVDSKQELLDFSGDKKSQERDDNRPVSSVRININTANLDELIQIPGIGEKTAGKILELRETKIRFKYIDELLEVKGIGEAKLNKLKEFIIIE
ncbi:MAG: helix-hairpin-helix domain-containing protein [Melioribacteraceae bacterium]|nr:helix-hairpin-helix domain-containing protein [Melioribacteraceae bacterium]